MKKILLVASALLMMSTVANAGTIVFTNGAGDKTVDLTYTATDIGGGLYNYAVYFDDPANASASWFAQLLGFTGKINQVSAFGGAIIVNTNTDANLYAGLDPNYSKTLDSYFFLPVAATPVNPGFTDTAGPGLLDRTYSITAGSPGGEGYDLIQIGQIIAAGDINVSGVIGRSGQTFSGAGVMTAVIPEPSTFVLAGMGAVGLISLARRRKTA